MAVVTMTIPERFHLSSIWESFLWWASRLLWNFYFLFILPRLARFSKRLLSRDSTLIRVLTCRIPLSLKGLSLLPFPYPITTYTRLACSESRLLIDILVSFRFVLSPVSIHIHVNECDQSHKSSSLIISWFPTLWLRYCRSPDRQTLKGRNLLA